MSESSLSVSYNELRRYVAMLLGYDRTYGNWSATQITEVDDIINAGLRRFYRAADWTFLRQTTTLAISVAGDYDYDLPDDFGAMDGHFTYPAASGPGYGPIKPRNEQQIREMRQIATVTGPPAYYAIRPKSSTGSTGQRFEAIFFPTPGASYTLSYRYMVLCSTLSASFPYPLGGQTHAECIKEFVLAEAEQTLDENQGIHAGAAMRELQASLRMDATSITPGSLGYNGDPGNSSPIFDRNISSETSTYNGTLWS